MDLFARKIIAWTLSDTMEVSTVIETINKAKAYRKIDSPLIIHTDRGSQYVSNAWREATEKILTEDHFEYYNFQITEGSGVPESVAAVPISYMSIARAKEIPNIFKCIASAKTGVMFNCTAGKDRTGVVAAILLLHAGVCDEDIMENYVLTKEYGKGRLELVHKNFPELDMNIVTPCKMFMEEFLRLFRAEYDDTDTYFRMIGLNDEEIKALKDKL